VTLEQYLSASYRSGAAFSNPHPTARDVRVNKYLSGSLLTSYADVVVVDTLMRLSGNSRDRLAVRSARELRPRDLEQGAFVFVGSPSSNPWVSYFQDKLNFRSAKAYVEKSLKFFQNQHPKSGEQATYQGLAFTGSSGEDYATISLLPLANGRGSVSHPAKDCNRRGPEAAGLFLADARQPAKAFRKHSGSPAPPHNLSTSKPSSARKPLPGPQCYVRCCDARDSPLSQGSIYFRSSITWPRTDLASTRLPPAPGCIRFFRRRS